MPGRGARPAPRLAIAIQDYDTTENGRPFIVMELVEGSDLRRVIDREGPLGVARSLKIGQQAAAALADSSAPAWVSYTLTETAPSSVRIR